MSTESSLNNTQLSSKAEELENYLRRKLEDDESGELYIKGKFISDDVDLSAKQIGQYMKQLQNAPSNINIEKWSYSSATTWRITN